jgi:hypothetical protein
MSRRIVSATLQAAGPSAATDVDSYFDRLIKYIPSDVVAGWVVVSGIIRASKGTDNQPGHTTLWLTFATGVVFTAIWTWVQTTKPNAPKPILQVIISAIAFAIWAYALGGPFPEWIPGLYRPVTASIVLVGYTLLAAKIVPK